MSRKITIFAMTLFGVCALAGPALADGDVTKGATIAKKCLACHSLTDAKNKVGPSLVGVVGRPIASVADYKYSDDMLAFAKEAGNWDEAHLNSYLENPKASVAKTKMAFAGIKSPEERADLVAYLKTLVP